MAEPYTYEQLLAFLDRQGPDAACGHYLALGTTLRQLTYERDEARRVAHELAVAINRREPCVDQLCDFGVCPEVRAGLVFRSDDRPKGDTRHG